MSENIVDLRKGGKKKREKKKAQDSPHLLLCSSYKYHNMQPNTMGSLSMVGVPT